MKTREEKAFSLRPLFNKHPRSGDMFADSLGRMVGLSRLQQIYDNIRAQDVTGIGFVNAAMEHLGISVDVSDSDVQLIPKSGPTVVVSNHPMGTTEGLLLMHVIHRVRPDVKFLTTSLATRFPEMADHIIAVDSLGDDGAGRRNAHGLLRAMHWVKRGGLLVVFPSGSVSRLDLKRARITDPPWQSGIAHLVRRTGAAVVPMHIDGHSGALFQFLAPISSRARALMLGRMLLKQQGHKIPIQIGRPIVNRKLVQFDCDQQMVDYLRLRCYLLSRRNKWRARQATRNEAELEEIVPPIKRDHLEREISRLPQDQLLLSSGDYDVYYGTARQLPNILLELGRLREITFRAVGEGTGHAIDLTPHDHYYVHLFVWHRKDREILGAYRLGRADQIIRTHGVKGIYTNDFFAMDPKLFKQLNDQALEMGRSFVQQRYQRSPSSLLLLWKGISRYLHKHPQYRYLFGPVSISNDYTPMSHQLLCRCLRTNVFDRGLSRLVRARNPFRFKADWRLCPDARVGKALPLTEVSEFVSDLEADHKSIPILVKQYLKLGGRLLAFGVDPDFGNVVDGLLVVDMAQADPKRLKRYMGAENLREYRAYHAGLLKTTAEQTEANTPAA